MDYRATGLADLMPNVDSPVYWVIFYVSLNKTDLAFALMGLVILIVNLNLFNDFLPIDKPSTWMKE